MEGGDRRSWTTAAPVKLPDISSFSDISLLPVIALGFSYLSSRNTAVRCGRNKWMSDNHQVAEPGAEPALLDSFAMFDIVCNKIITIT